jgi:predicted  nucleic acid-binding Zn-ribbon protein
MAKFIILVSLFAAVQSAKVSPVQKVIELLDENKVKIANDLAAEEKEMAEYTEYCDKSSSDLGYSIKTATSTIEDLSATIEEATNKIPAYEDQIATLGTEGASKQKQLYEATELRKKEKADFDAAEKELESSIDQLARAVTIIKREMSTITGFAQGASGAKTRKQKEVEVAVKVLSKIIDSGSIRTGTARQIEGLLQTGSMEKDDLSFRHGQPQATQVAYESKSGGIVEKIEELKEEAEESLSSTRSSEMKAVQDFKMLEQSLSNGITVGNDQISTAKSALGLTTEELNKAKGDLGETEASKAADEKTLAELKHDCEESAANWAQRQESARAEMGAINKAIEVLSEGVRVLLQTKSTKRFKNVLDKYDDEADVEAPVQPARQRLADTLKGMSKKFGSFALMELASAAVSDPFVKIRGLIEDMIAKLLKEAQEEATQKAFCDEEMGKSKASEKEKTMTLDKLNSRIDKATARTAELEEAIKTLEDEIATLDASVAEATKLRTEEKETNTKAIKDFGDAAAATEKAIKILKDFYDNAALVQISATTHSKSKSDDDAPEFGSAKSGAADVIVGILEMSNEDFVKLHSETETSEMEAQEGYEKMMNDSKASKGAKEAEVKASISEIKSLKVALENHGEDKSMTSSELDAVLSYIEKLKPQCEEKVMSYAEKKARREAEIAGLKEALEILASEAALVQTGRSLRRVALH